jgi:hypothetical protein
MSTYNIHEGKSQLSRLINAREHPRQRVRGVLKGQVKLGPEFDEPLPPELLESFEA